MVLPHRNEPAKNRAKPAWREWKAVPLSEVLSIESHHRSFWKNGSTGTRIIEGWALGKLIPSSRWSSKTDQTLNSDKLSGFSAWTWLTPPPKGPSQSSALRHRPPPLGAQPGQLGCLLCPADNVWLKAGEAARCFKKARQTTLSVTLPPFFAGKQLLGQDRGSVVDFQISVHRDSWIFSFDENCPDKKQITRTGRYAQILVHMV